MVNLNSILISDFFIQNNYSYYTFKKKKTNTTLFILFLLTSKQLYSNRNKIHYYLKQKKVSYFLVNYNFLDHYLNHQWIFQYI